MIEYLRTGIAASVTASGLQWAAAAMAVLSAFFWCRAAMIETPEEVDLLVRELQRQGRLNAWAAGSMAISAILAVLATLAGTPLP